MTPEQTAAFVNAAVARALIRALGMTAENMQQAQWEEPMAYTDKDFNKLLDEEGIGHNSVLTVFGG